MRDAEKTVGNMIDKLKTAFIGSIDSEGFPNMKAMLQPRKREGIKTIYLTTNTSSMRVAQYRENNHACIYFCDTRFFSCLLYTSGEVSGTDIRIFRYTSTCAIGYYSFLFRHLTGQSKQNSCEDKMIF